MTATPGYVQYTVRPAALTALTAAMDAVTRSSDDIVSDQFVIQYDDMGHSSTQMSPALRQLIAAAVPGQTPGAFRVVRRAMNAKFEALHPRGADGRFINKGGAVKWKSPSGLWQRGVVDAVHSDGSADVTDSSGVKSKRPVKSLYAAQEAVAKLSPSNFTMVQGQGGSNSGAFFQDPKTGDVWYVKTPASSDHVANEVAATKLYGLAGVAVPEIRTSPDGKKFLSKVENSEGWYQLSDGDKANAREDIRKNFIVDAWLGNYDAPRNDNIRVTDEGVPIRVDTGGALKYRARGGVKPKLPPDMTAEIAKLKQQSAYRGLSQNDEEDAVARILAISPDDIKDAIKTASLDPTIADDLIARRAWLAATYGYQLPETTPAGKAALAARAAANASSTGGSNGSAPVGTNNSAGNPGNSVPGAPTLAQAVRKRDSGQAAALAPGSPIWLRKKPVPPAGEAKYPDTWTVDFVSADGQTVGLKTGKGRQLTVPVASVEVLRANKASVNSKFATGEQPSIGDRIAIDLPAGTDPKTHPGDGEIVELYPMYAKVKMDNGSSKVVVVKKMSLVPDKGAGAPATSAPSASTVAPKIPKSSSALYATPYDGNTHQNDYIKQAETLIRAGSFQLKTFLADAVLPTQSESQTQGSGSGRGAKDLGPIVARINGKDYLLDGHHRAYNSAKIKAQYVDLDAEGITGNSKSSSPKTNPKGVPFDLSAHDFKANPNPIGYSLTHKSPVAYVGKAVDKDGTTSDRDVIAILPNKGNPKDPIPVRIRADNFRSLTSVDHDALVNAPAAAPKTPKAKAVKDFNTLDEAKTILKPVKISVKYPVQDQSQHPELYEMRAGDRVMDIRRQDTYSNGIGGIYLFRDGKVHYLGASVVGDTRNSYFTRRKAADTDDNLAVLVQTLSSTSSSNVNDITAKLGKADAFLFAKAAGLANADREHVPADFTKLLPKKMSFIDKNASQPSSYNLKREEVDWPSWLSHNIQSVTMKTDGPKIHTDAAGNKQQFFPSFVYDKDNDKMYYIGDTDMRAGLYGEKELGLLKPDKWVALTDAQIDFYFDRSEAKNTGAGTGDKAKTVKSGDLSIKMMPSAGTDNISTIPANAAIRNSKGELLTRDNPTKSRYYSDALGYVSEIQGQVDKYKNGLSLLRGDKIGYYGMDLDTFTDMPTSLPVKSGSAASVVSDVAAALDPNTKPPKPGDVLPKHRNPYVESKVSPIQALNYDLPTSQDSLDAGSQDIDFLAARLVTPEIAERVSRPGSRARQSFKSTSDGSAHKDLLLYEYTKNIGGDAGVIRLGSADFNAYVAANGLEVLYRGLGSSESTHDLRSGTYFAGEGVYGSGSYVSNIKGTAQNSYASGVAANVTRLVTRPSTKGIMYGDLFYDMVESVVKGSSDRVDYMAGLGLSPSMDDIKLPAAKARASNLSRHAKSVLSAQFGTATISPESDRATMIADFYEKKGFTLYSVKYDGGRWGTGNEMVLTFKHPNKPGETFTVRVTNPRYSQRAMSRANKLRNKTQWDPIVDFSGTKTPASTYSTNDDSISKTATSGDAFTHGFSSPQDAMRFLAAIDSRFNDDTMFSSDPKKANAKTEEGATALVEKSTSDVPELTKILGQTARLEFIQDVGRFALAAGYDYYTIPVGGRENYIVITNRNAMIMSR